MPIIKNSDLPTYDRLINEGRQIIPLNRAESQDIRELHIGFINLMPDAALEATERQFFRLIGESNRLVQTFIHSSTLPIYPRGEKAQAHINKYYEEIEDLKKVGLDALIITGANVSESHPITDLEIWAPLRDLLEWADKNVTSTLCSCLSGHAAYVYKHGIPPIKHEQKKWGVYPHHVMNRAHPLVSGMNTKLDAPHSRNGEITVQQYKTAGMQILIQSEEVGVYLATSNDGFRRLYLQGHPEYDSSSLLKEYKREIERFKSGERESYPPFPENYFGPIAQEKLNQLKKQIVAGDDVSLSEEEFLPLIENTWTDSARSLIATWIGHVYQTTNVDRQKQFMDGVNPDNPLNM